MLYTSFSQCCQPSKVIAVMVEILRERAMMLRRTYRAYLVLKWPGVDLLSVYVHWTQNSAKW
jgi:hypothetical protein